MRRPTGLLSASVLAALLAMSGGTLTANEQERGDDASTAHGYRLTAEQGDAEAQFNLGVRYFHGRGVPEDIQEAIRWVRLAAEQGHAEARLSLGVLYDEGRGVPRDHEEAVRWYRLAAEQGHPEAQFNLGVSYDEGEGVAREGTPPVAELDLQQARYEAALAERRYAACDPDNRLIAAELEKSWEAALRRVQACEARLDAMRSPSPQLSAPDLAGLADDLKAAWSAPGVSMRARQRLLRTLIAGIAADVDEEARDVLLTIRWAGGRHSRLRVRKPRSGEHRRTALRRLRSRQPADCR